jgi:hypothetical protein
VTGPRRSLIAAVVSVMLFSSSACSETSEPVWLDDIGDPCRSDSYSVCVDSLHVERCEDDVWAVTSCDVVCAEMGMAYVAEGCDETCICTLKDPMGCTPGETVCASSDELSICDGAQLWSNFDCATVCADAGLASVDCVVGTDDVPASCWCTSEGTACDPADASICVDEAVLAVCVDEVWVFQSCNDICEEAGMCLPSSAPHECTCE